MRRIRNWVQTTWQSGEKWKVVLTGLMAGAIVAGFGIGAKVIIENGGALVDLGPDKQKTQTEYKGKGVAPGFEYESEESFVY